MGETTRSGSETASQSIDSDERDVAASTALPDVDPDRYELHEEFSRGGSGRLVRATDRRLGRPVAIKILRRLGAATEARFQREAELTARLTHPAIVPIYDFGRWPTGEPFYVMKLVTGKTLKAIIAASRRLDDRLVLIPSVLAVADAIAYAHNEGVLHRDIKPANILIGSFGETIVIDWGIAKTIAGSREDDGPETDEATSKQDKANASATVTGAVTGTPAYMAPEQARGEWVDERCDVYAIAAVLYHVLTGHPPYDGETGSEILDRVLAGPPPSVEVREPGVPRELAAIVARGLAYDRSARYASAHDLADDLRRFLSGQLVGAHHYSRGVLAARWAKRHRGPLFVAGLALAALTTTVVASFWRITHERNVAEQERRSAEERRTRLLLEQGRSWLERDPTVALGWLKGYVANGGTNLTDARLLAAQAISRGAARHLLRGWERAKASPSGAYVAGIHGGSFAVWDDATNHVRVLAPHQAATGVVEFSPDSRALVVIDGVRLRLWDLTNTGPPRDLGSLAEPAASAVFAPDGRTIAIGGSSGKLTLVTLADGKQRENTSHRGALQWISWTSDAHRVLTTGSDDGTSRLWDATGAALAGTQLALPPMAVPALSADGSRIAWPGDDNSVRIGTIDSAGTIANARALHGHKGLVLRARFSPDGKQLASCSYDRTVRLWDLRDDSSRVLATHEDFANDVMFTANGELAVTAGLDRKFQIHDLRNDSTFIMRGPAMRSTFRRFSDDGHAMIDIDATGVARIWRLPASLGRTLRGHATDTIALAPPNDPQRLVSLGIDRSVRTWDLQSRTVRVLPTPPIVGTSLDAVLGGRFIASAGEQHHIWTLDTESGKSCDLAGHVGVVNSLHFSNDAQHLVSGGNDRSVWSWNLAECAGRVLGQHDGRVWVMGSSANGDVAAVGDSPTISLWDREGKRRVLEGHEATIYAIDFSSDGKLLLSASADKNVRVWDVASGTSRVLRGHTAAVRTLQIADNGQWAASGSDDETVRLWRLDTGESRVLPHGASATALRFTPDGTRLVTAVGDVILVWNTADGAPMAVLRGHREGIVDLAVASDGSWIASSAQDKTVHIWPMPAAVDADAKRWLAGVTTVELAADDSVASLPR